MMSKPKQRTMFVSLHQVQQCKHQVQQSLLFVINVITVIHFPFAAFLLIKFLLIFTQMSRLFKQRLLLQRLLKKGQVAKHTIVYRAFLLIFSFVFSKMCFCRFYFLYFRTSSRPTTTNWKNCTSLCFCVYFIFFCDWVSSHSKLCCEVWERNLQPPKTFCFFLTKQLITNFVK